MSVGGKSKDKRESENSLARLKEKRKEQARTMEAQAREEITSLVGRLEKLLGESVQLGVEPNVNTLDNIIDKKDKKKVKLVLVMGVDKIYIEGVFIRIHNLTKR